jgi:hypothetical protein
MIKTLNKLVIEEIYIERYIWQTYSQHCTKWGKTETTFFKVMKSVHSLHFAWFNAWLPSQSSKATERNKNNTDRKERSQIILIL